MPKKVRVNSTMPKEVHDKAIQDSKDMFGEENVSAFISYLIKNHKSKK